MAGLSGFFWTETSLATALAGASVEVYQQAEELMLEVARQTLEYAKANAPWQDRTGDARRGLNVSVDGDGDSIFLQLFHTVDYGLWLEVIQNGKFAIIMPTLQGFSLQRMADQQLELGGVEQL